jgi:hypothetical protein
MPAMSTSFNAVGTIRCGVMNFVIRSSRPSGIGTTPSFGSMVQNG